MKKIAGLSLRPMLCLLLVATLSGCGGYANTSGDSSGVQVYGTVDAGVVHQSR
tara:strand:- start:283861 stop:284019 length:159 start_codon:yes stop_codon:yes gene_type:complete